jgi:type IV pilus assembly protein PilM
MVRVEPGKMSEVKPKLYDLPSSYVEILSQTRKDIETLMQLFIGFIGMMVVFGAFLAFATIFNMTTVNILDDGIPVLTRDLTFGTRALTLDLQRERAVTAEEAHAALRGETSDYELREFLTERAQEIARGVERATAFLETGEAGPGIGRLYLCGGGVAVPGLAEVLAERMQVETHVASALERVQVKASALDFVELQEMAPMLMTSVGLALRRAA